MRQRIRRLALARLVSIAGTQAAAVAITYQVYAVTRSELWVTMVLAISGTLGGLFGPLSGYIADHFNRRIVMVSSEVLSGGAFLVMVFLHRPGTLLVGLVVATITGAPFRAASRASIPNLVEEEHLRWANAQTGVASNLALVAGPVGGGVLTAVWGPSSVYGVNAGSFLVSALLIASVSGKFSSGEGPVDVRSSASWSRTAELLAGYRIVATHATIGLLAGSSAFAYAAFGAAMVIDPALTHFFHAGSVGYGLLTAVWGGGTVIGAVAAGRFLKDQHAMVAVVWGMTAMAVSLGAVAVLPSFALIVASGAIGGIGSGFTFIPLLLLMQRYTEDRVRGRVMAAAETADQSLFLLGMGVAAAAETVFGPHHAYATAGLLLAVATAMAVAAARRQSALSIPVPVEIGS